MTQFAELAKSRSGGVFRCHATVPDDALERAARHSLHVVPVQLGQVRDKNAFLTAVAHALRFPEYFGHNWDAFYDCLLDLVPADGAGTLLVLRDASAFARAEPDEFAAAVAVMQDAADYWEGEARTLAVVIEVDAPALAPELAEITLPAM
ncbi:MAG: barstar family protein [Betaproteobacteria bacterium]